VKFNEGKREFSRAKWKNRGGSGSETNRQLIAAKELLQGGRDGVGVGKG